MRLLALLVLVAAAALAPAPRSQVSYVPNTGCAQATWPTTTGEPRIGQSLGFAWACEVPTRQAIAMFGSATGGGFRFGAPITCEPGPCTWFPGPIGGLYHAWPAQIGAGSWTLAIPNDPRLVGAGLGIQCVCWCT